MYVILPDLTPETRTNTWILNLLMSFLSKDDPVGSNIKYYG